MAFNTITSIFDNLLNSVEEYDINNTPLDVNLENMSILVSCIKNYYKIKIHILLSTIASPDGKINMLNKFLPEIFNKISGLEIEQGYKFKILEYIAKEILTPVDIVNNQLVTLCSDKNINMIYGCYMKIGQLEKNILQMYSVLNLTFTKQYEVQILEKIIKIFSELDEKFKKIFFEETYQMTESKSILNSYFEMCISIKHVLEQLSKIDIVIVKNFIKVQIINAYDKYYIVIDKNELSLDSNYLLLNTIQKINSDIGVLQLDSNDLIKKYESLYCKVSGKIISVYSKQLSQIIKTNVNYETVRICTEDIISIFNQLERTYLDEELSNTIFTAMVGKLSTELTNIFICNNENVLMTDELIVHFDILAAELADSLLEICKIHNYNKENIINTFKKIKLVRDYYAFVDSNEELIKEEFMSAYGNLEQFEQLKSNKKHKFHPMSKISNFTTAKISNFTTGKLSNFTPKKISAYTAKGFNYLKEKM